MYCQLAYCRDCIKSCERNVYKITHNASRIQPSFAPVKACTCCLVLSSPDAKFDEVMKIDVKHLKLYLSNKNEPISSFKEKTELAEQVIKVNRRSLMGPSSSNTSTSRNSTYAATPLNNATSSSSFNRNTNQSSGSQNTATRNESSFPTFQSMLNLNTNSSNSTSPTNQINQQPTPEQQRAFEILNEMLARQFNLTSSTNRNSDQSQSTNSAGTESPTAETNRTTSSQPIINRMRSMSGEHGTSIHEPTLSTATSTPNIKESTPPAPVRIRASLSDLKSEQDIENLTIRQIKEILAFNFVDYKGCFERSELVQKLKILYASNVANQKLLNELNEPNNNNNNNTVHPSTPTSKSCQNLLNNDSSTGGGNGGEKPVVEVCKICMDNAIDCVLLNCGHMVSCVKCGKVLAECPICRQNIVKVVRVFKA